MELNLFIQIGLPVSLALIMFSLGLTIETHQFLKLMQSPRAPLVGLLAQLLLVPLLALLVITVFSLPPYLAAGLMILSFCPGGTTSNWFSHMAKANVPLSISLTLLASLITPFTIPFLSELSLQMLLGDAREISIPVGQTMFRLVIITVLPVSLGMLIRARWFNFSNNWQPIIYKIATLLFLSVIAGIIIQQWTRLPGFLALSGVACLSMIVCAMLLGMLIARVIRLGSNDARTIAIEVGMQNGGMALVVTQNVLQSPELSIMPVMYGLLMLIPVFLFTLWSSSPSRL